MKHLGWLKRAFGHHAFSERNVYKWYKQFKEGRNSVEDEERAYEQHLMKIEELVLANRPMTFIDLTDAVGISKGFADTILKDILGLKLVKS